MSARIRELRNDVIAFRSYDITFFRLQPTWGFWMARRYTKREQQEFRQSLHAALHSFSEKLKAVGSSPEERLIWLTAFVKREASDDSTRVSAAKELDVFLSHHYKSWAGDFNSAVDLQQFIEPNDVPRIQVEVRALLDGLSPDGNAWFSSSIADGLLWRRDRGVFLVTRAPGLPQVLASVVNLLMTVGPRLRRCETPSCRRLFSMKRPGQKRCTTRCGGTDRVREWRQKNRERLSENRHRQYAKKVALRLPGVRVGRRRASAKT